MRANGSLSSRRRSCCGVLPGVGALPHGHSGGPSARGGSHSSRPEGGLPRKSGGPTVGRRSNRVDQANAASAAHPSSPFFSAPFLFVTGTAGSLLSDLPLEDVIISGQSQPYDVDFSAWGFPKGRIPALGSSAFAADPELVFLARQRARKLRVPWPTPVATALKGDRFVSSEISPRRELPGRRDRSGGCGCRPGGLLGRHAPSPSPGSVRPGRHRIVRGVPTAWLPGRPPCPGGPYDPRQWTERALSRAWALRK